MPIDRNLPLTDEVEELLASCLERPAEEWSEAVERAARAHSALADELRARLRMIQALDVHARTDKGLGYPDRIGEFSRLERIGSGGMGVVFRAYDESLERDVALKLVRAERLFFDGALARFQREVATVAQLNHPGIVSVYSVGMFSAAGREALPYFAMELLEGATLSDVVQALSDRAPESLAGHDLFAAAGGAGAPPELWRASWTDAVLRIGLQIGRALEYAHGKGVVHRDVKPSNIMLSPEGRATLFDFGLTATQAPSPARLTATGHPVGTLVYMAPEQIEERGEPDARADVYALGVTLYELLTLQVPFVGASSVALQRAVLSGDVAGIRLCNRRVSVDAQVVVLKAMERRVTDRYPSATALCEDLERLLAQRPIRATAPGPAKHVVRWVQRRPTAAASVALTAILLTGVPSFFLWLSSRHTSELRELVELEQSAKSAALAANAELEDVLSFALGLFRRATPERNGGEFPDALQLLRMGADEMPALADRPASRARIQLALGELFGALTDVPSAQPHFDAALAYYRERTDEGARDRLMQGLRHSAHNLLFQRRFAEAERQLDEAFALAVERYGDDAPELEPYLATRADVDRDLGRFDASIAARRRCIELLEAARRGDECESLARARGLLGVTLKDSGDLVAARPLLERAVAWDADNDGALGPDACLLVLTLADMDQLAGALAPALEGAQRAHARLLATLGAEHLSTQQAEFAVAEALGRLGRYGEALPIVARLADEAAGRLPRGHPLLLRMLQIRIACLGALGRYPEVAPICAEHDLVPLFIETHGAAHPNTRRVIHGLAVSHQVRREYEACERRLEQLEEIERGVAPWSPEHADVILMLTALRFKTQVGADHSASEALLEELVAGVGDTALQVASSMNGQTYEAGAMALQFLASLAGQDPARQADAAAFRERAARRQQ